MIVTSKDGGNNQGGAGEGVKEEEEEGVKEYEEGE